nr:immunoglobulin light chain junction region [Macaca mulatta]MPO04252.1 immunoglobulin light chain junction region [Macaca mulatta]MPO07276.1 immunoglobulin light chain junction region [Macaca mulatta]MPO08313.1 immunoglobulin light chain junction region [Macaca mulatta]MPO12885.1 immunoglobulin light chain junction region [Macaca mulatta]
CSAWDSTLSTHLF